MRGNDINGESRYGDLVCMACFVRCAVEAGLPSVGWRLMLHPEPDGLTYTTPSGRVWDAERFVWVEKHDAPRCDCSVGDDFHDALDAYGKAQP